MHVVCVAWFARVHHCHRCASTTFCVVAEILFGLRETMTVGRLEGFRRMLRLVVSGNETLTREILVTLQVRTHHNSSAPIQLHMQVDW